MAGSNGGRATVLVGPAIDVGAPDAAVELAAVFGGGGVGAVMSNEPSSDRSLVPSSTPLDVPEQPQVHDHFIIYPVPPRAQ